MALASQIDPARNAVVVSTSDTVNLTNDSRAIYVGGAGDVVALLTEDTTPITFSAVLAGTLLPLAVKRVNATGTTATLIIAIR